MDWAPALATCPSPLEPKPHVSTYSVGSEGGGRLDVQDDLTVCLELQVRGLPCHRDIFKSVLAKPPKSLKCVLAKK